MSCMLAATAQHVLFIMQSVHANAVCIGSIVSITVQSVKCCSSQKAASELSALEI